jgi:hypothetical protein
MAEAGGLKPVYTPFSTIGQRGAAAMIDTRFTALDFYCAAGRPAAHRHHLLLQSALGRFNAERRAAIFHKVESILFGRPRRLWNLAAIQAGQVRGRHYAGIKCVTLGQICGSMGRTGDFDRCFHPLDDRLRDRWVSVAMARSQDIPFPPVSLVQIGACYFVEDGHHRISVARAMGQTAIDAEVTVWDVCGPLPWEARAPAPVLPQSAVRPA